MENARSHPVPSRTAVWISDLGIYRSDKNREKRESVQCSHPQAPLDYEHREKEVKGVEEGRRPSYKFRVFDCGIRNGTERLSVIGHKQPSLRNPLQLQKNCAREIVTLTRSGRSGQTSANSNACAIWPELYLLTVKPGPRRCGAKLLLYHVASHALGSRGVYATYTYRELCLGSMVVPLGARDEK